MKDEFVQFVFILIALVVSAAAEEILPAFAGVGIPLLMALVMVTAPRMGVLPGVITAVGAGAFEDALASLPPMTSVCFFVIVALLSRREYFPRMFLIAAFPLFEIWSGLCVFGPMGDLFVRVLVSLPLGAAALAVQGVALDWAGRRAGIDE